VLSRGGLAEVFAVAGLSLAVGLDEQGAGQPQRRATAESLQDTAQELFPADTHYQPADAGNLPSLWIFVRPAETTGLARVCRRLVGGAGQPVMRPLIGWCGLAG
jgi:hypothetical protein